MWELAANLALTPFGECQVHRNDSDMHSVNKQNYPLVIQHSHGIDGPFIDGLPVYLLKMVIFHGYVK